MKVLLYTHAFAPKVGGVETIVMSLATGLATQDREGPILVTLATATPRGDFDDSSLPFRVVRQPGLLQLLRLIRAADVVHLAGPCFLPMTLSLLYQKPVVVEHHGFQAICPNGQLLYEPTRTPCPGHFMAGRYGKCVRCNARNSLLRSVSSWLLTFPRRWICAHVSSNVMPVQWLSIVLGLPRATTIYHGLPALAGPNLPAAVSSPPTVAFMGRLVSTKGVAVLLRAASRLKTKGLSFAVKIIGDGPQRAQLEAQTQVLGLAERVTFLGYQPDAKLREVLSDVGTIVMPSLGGEVFGLVAAENMMRGLLPIVSAGGALAEVVGDTGLTFPPGDDEALAGCLERVLRSPDFENRERLRARERAMTQFVASRMVEEHVALYQSLVMNGQGACQKS
jgi:glycogen(starch) synthase